MAFVLYCEHPCTRRSVPFFMSSAAIIYVNSEIFRTFDLLSADHESHFERSERFSEDFPVPHLAPSDSVKYTSRLPTSRPRIKNSKWPLQNKRRVVWIKLTSTYRRFSCARLNKFHTCAWDMNHRLSHRSAILANRSLDRLTGVLDIITER